MGVLFKTWLLYVRICTASKFVYLLRRILHVAIDFNTSWKLNVFGKNTSFFAYRRTVALCWDLSYFCPWPCPSFSTCGLLWVARSGSASCVASSSSSHLSVQFQICVRDLHGSLILKISRCNVSVSAALQHQRTAAKRVIWLFHVQDHVEIGKPLLIALHPPVTHSTEFVDNKEAVDDLSYDFCSSSRTGKREKLWIWQRPPQFPAAQWHYLESVWRTFSLFFTSWNICTTVLGAQHCVEPFVTTTNPSHRTSPFWKSARAQATASLN